MKKKKKCSVLECSDYGLPVPVWDQTVLLLRV